jgi:formylglycine-generating enzyme required for sulfatase activity
MVLVTGGRFRMGSADFYPEERPVHDAEVDDFWLDEHPVTNAQFRRFVKATGYVTVAEHSRLTRRSFPTYRRPTSSRLVGVRWFEGTDSAG